MPLVAELPSVEQFTESLKQLRANLAELVVHESYTIEDYPIGGRHRGKCKLWVDAKKGHGYRMSRATTDKNGRWCNPKSSVYHSGVLAVVSGPIVEREAGWLAINPFGAHLYSASWDSRVLLKSPCSSTPRRTPSTYTINGVPNELPADPPELCDLWDVWKPAAIELINDFARRHKEVCGK